MAFWAGRRVLVTGAGGFIGSHLAERLAACGARVRAFVHYNARGTNGWLDDSPVRYDLEIFAGDIRDRDLVAAAVKGMDIVFHLAALIGIPYSYHAPLSYVQTNVEGTLNVLQAAREAGVGRVVHTSTSEVYGTARSVPIAETHPLCAQSPYAASKIGADKLAEAFHLSYGLPVVLLRPFNTYGPRQSLRAIVPTIASQLLASQKVKVGSLSPRRDLNFVSDTIAGFMQAASSESAVGETINIGSGRETSVGDLVGMMAAIVGCKPVIECESCRVRPPGSEVERLLADNTKARSLLAWTPEVPLEKGLALTVEWFRQRAPQQDVARYTV